MRGERGSAPPLPRRTRKAHPLTRDRAQKKKQEQRDSTVGRHGLVPRGRLRAVDDYGRTDRDDGAAASARVESEVWAERDEGAAVLHDVRDVDAGEGLGGEMEGEEEEEEGSRK